jgi:hypothetical protein
MRNFRKLCYTIFIFSFILFSCSIQKYSGYSSNHSKDLTLIYKHLEDRVENEGKVNELINKNGNNYKFLHKVKPENLLKIESNEIVTLKIPNLSKSNIHYEKNEVEISEVTKKPAINKPTSTLNNNEKENDDEKELDDDKKVVNSLAMLSVITAGLALFSIFFPPFILLLGFVPFSLGLIAII